MNQRLVLLPGLGADRRMFGPLRDTGLEFDVLEAVPAHPEESLRDYAQRLGRTYDWEGVDTIGGVSLGGMIAHEIARAEGIPRVVLISTVKNSREFPFYFQFLRWLPLHRWISGRSIQRRAPRNPFRVDPAITQVLESMRQDASPDFLKWALKATVHWRQPESPPHYLHLHGTRDLMFPGILLGPRVRIHRGSHVMAMSHAEEIAGHIRSWMEP